MKTEEDEAFDEIARKQGHWGGGFMAKRAMAANKFQQPAPNKKRPLESDYASHVAYTRALEMYCDTLVQPVQEPVANSFEEYCKTLPPLWNTHISRTYAEQFFRAGQAAQPAQEPWANLTEQEWLNLGCSSVEEVRIGLAIQAKLKEKNT